MTPAGFEPATCPLGGGCSIQLSHGATRGLNSAVDAACHRRMRSSCSALDPCRMLRGNIRANIRIIQLTKTTQPPADPARRFRSLGRVGNDGQPGAAQSRRRVRRTRQRVLASAKALGYVPNKIAGALASNRVNLVAVIIPSHVQHGLSRGHDGHQRRCWKRPSCSRSSASPTILPRKGREGSLRDAVMASLGRHHRGAGAFGGVARHAAGVGHSGGRDHGCRRHAGRFGGRHLAPPRGRARWRARSSRGAIGASASWAPRCRATTARANASRASPMCWPRPASRSPTASSIPAARRWPRGAR